jgi:hypothetical protein
MKNSGMAGIWPLLFRAYTEKFNWNYVYHFIEIPILQQSFMFSLYLLTIHASQETTSDIYEAAFIEAFPTLLDQPCPPYSTPERLIGNSYSHLTFDCFTRFFGLTETIENREVTDAGGYRRIYRLKVMPLLGEAASFHLRG